MGMGSKITVQMLVWWWWFDASIRKTRAFNVKAPRLWLCLNHAGLNWLGTNEWIFGHFTCMQSRAHFAFRWKIYHDLRTTEAHVSTFLLCHIQYLRPSCLPTLQTECRVKVTVALARSWYEPRGSRSPAVVRSVNSEGLRVGTNEFRNARTRSEYSCLAQ